MGEHYTEFLERQAKKDQEAIEMLTEALEDIDRWGGEHGTHWCRNRARKALKRNGKND